MTPSSGLTCSQAGASTATRGCTCGSPAQRLSLRQKGSKLVFQKECSSHPFWERAHAALAVKAATPRRKGFEEEEDKMQTAVRKELLGLRDPGLKCPPYPSTEADMKDVFSTFCNGSAQSCACAHKESDIRDSTGRSLFIQYQGSARVKNHLTFSSGLVHMKQRRFLQPMF